MLRCRKTKNNCLTHEAESLSYYPPVILAVGRINGGMGNFIAAKTVKMLTWMFNSSVIPVISVVNNSQSAFRVFRGHSAVRD